MPLKIENPAFVKYISKKRWLRRMGWFQLPKFLMLDWKNQKIAVDMADWKGPSFHLINKGFETYEVENAQILESLLNDNSVYFDIGANIGIFIVRTKSKFPNLKVCAFEPDPKTFGLLNRTVTANEFKNVQVFQTALSDKVEEAMFYVDVDNSGGHSLSAEAILDEGDMISSSFKVKTETLDRVVEAMNLDRLDVIKLDVQRHEEHVLKGAAQTLARFKPHVLMECYFEDLNRENSPLLSPFKALGYWMMNTVTKEKILVSEYKGQFTHFEDKYCDVLFGVK